MVPARLVEFGALVARDNGGVQVVDVAIPVAKTICWDDVPHLNTTLCVNDVDALVMVTVKLLPIATLDALNVNDDALAIVLSVPVELFPTVPTHTPESVTFAAKLNE